MNPTATILKWADGIEADRDRYKAALERLQKEFKFEVDEYLANSEQLAVPKSEWHAAYVAALRLIAAQEDLLTECRKLRVEHEKLEEQYQKLEADYQKLQGSRRGGH